MYGTATGLREYMRGETYDELLEDTALADASARTAFAEELLTQASHTVDGYIGNAYDVPLTGTTNISLATKWSYAIAQYVFWQRSSYDVIPDKVQFAYEHAISQLNDVARGRFSLDESTESATGDDGGMTIWSPESAAIGDVDIGQYF